MVGSLYGALISRELRDQTDRFPRASSLRAIGEVIPDVLNSTADRSGLIRRIEARNAALGNASSRELIQKLADSRSVVIITGQQPGLLGGPTFVSIKAAGAIALAHAVEESTGHPTVPIFWNHAEDHDLDEANRHVDFLDHGHRVRRLNLGPRGHALSAVRWTRDAVEEIKRWSKSVDGVPLPEVGDSVATHSARCVLAALGQQKILLVEPSDIWPSALDILRRAVEDIEGLQAAIEEGRAGLRESGFPVGVERDHASPLFFLTQAGSRDRLVYDSGLWMRREKARVRRVEASCLMDAANGIGGSLSPNVLARPVVLQRALPVVAHVLGPGEVGYFGQLREVYSWAGLPMPVVWPRPRVTVLTPNWSRLLRRLGVDPTNIPIRSEDWPLPPIDDETRALLAAVESALDRALTPLESSISGQRSLEEAVRRLRRRVSAEFPRVTKAFSKFAERNSGVGRRERHAVREWIRPGGVPQDRQFDPWTLLQGTGVAPRDLCGSIDPLTGRSQLVEILRGDDDP